MQGLLHTATQSVLRQAHSFSQSEFSKDRAAQIQDLLHTATHSVLRQVHSFYQSEFSKERAAQIQGLLQTATKFPLSVYSMFNFSLKYFSSCLHLPLLLQSHLVLESSFCARRYQSTHPTFVLFNAVSSPPHWLLVVHRYSQIGPNDLLHLSLASHFKTCEVFLI